ncbi:pyrimidine dimer DNA glycosylase/endonuclease V [Micrococcus lacusdianchii]|uniref:pyrimidine dimer DNA glycosylase/endonuclease V n=1 Tax=Micrococcus lacusdianchii TaxID=2915940 RepID=UPI0020066F4A|nr:pyrimidine dimer DNA glycosylase/endonuclease V [Micrococcus sp. JXJ CY 30]
MRLWTLHPRHLDRQGLTGAWREALLAQAALARRTRGYRNHPQLERFRDHGDPAAAIGAFLSGIALEATARGYRFDVSRIDRPLDTAPDADGVPGELVLPFRLAPIPATTGQRDHEWARLRAKLADRSPEWLARWEHVAVPDLHPLFELEEGPVASWERV